MTTETTGTTTTGVAEHVDRMVRGAAPGDLADGPDDGWLPRVEALTTLAEGMADVTDQGRYEDAFAAFRAGLDDVERRLEDRRFLDGGDRPTRADLGLFAVVVRLDPIYFPLFKANPYLLEDLPNVHGHARDLYERPWVEEATDVAAFRDAAWRARTDLAAHGIVPRGGLPDLDAPHFRDELAAASEGAVDVAVEEDPNRRRRSGEWVRGQSRFRHRVGDVDFPSSPGRYHVFAPYNCPWSHRALLGRAVKGLKDVVGASVVYFRRDPDHGWQFNPRIPGCTPDQVGGEKYVRAYYEAEGSDERSVPVLYDTETRRIVNNESAEILRMFDDGFGALATRDVPLYPPAHRDEIDRVNRLVYTRINNGAYKAGFTRSQAAYDRAYARYFAALRWVNDRLEDRKFLVGTDHPTEADLRLFPTVFRHDAVYFARFRLNGARIRDFPRVAGWLDRMLRWPGVAEASDLDHARNGYFGRSGNGLVPAGPVPLGLSPKDFSPEVWLNSLVDHPG